MLEQLLSNIQIHVVYQFLKKVLIAIKQLLACDPISAFGGIVSCNFKITNDIALELSNIFLEVVIGNGFDHNALKILKKKRI